MRLTHWQKRRPREWVRTWVRTWLLAGVLALGATAGHGQHAPDSARLVLKVAVPLLAYRTYEPAVEYRAGRYVSLELAPRLTTGRVPGWVSARAYEEHDAVRGYGGRLGARFYLPNTGLGTMQLAGLYLGVRAEYQHLRLDYLRDAWGEDLADNGLRYYVRRPRPFRETIRRAGGAAVLGYHCPVIHPRLRLDTSLAFNQLYSTSSLGDATRYDSSATDYAHSGGFLEVGLSLGWVVW